MAYHSLNKSILCLMMLLASAGMAADRPLEVRLVGNQGSGQSEVSRWMAHLAESAGDDLTTLHFDDHSAADFLQDHAYLGVSGKLVRNILIVRDPFAWIDDRLGQGAALGDRDIDLWKENARFIWRQPNHGSHRQSWVLLFYDRWRHDAGYRQKIAGYLGLSARESGWLPVGQKHSDAPGPLAEPLINPWRNDGDLRFLAVEIRRTLGLDKACRDRFLSKH